MKKTLILLILVVFLIPGCDEPRSTANQEGVKISNRLAADAMISTPIPALKHFQERKTIAKWAERWDTPSIPTYIYVISYGKIIGYYVADGKPAATTSYITPPEQTRWGGNGAVISEELPDLDGTYGDNNPGIRFFTAEGVAVEIGGNIGYIYSDAPIALDVPLLSRR